ncbi:hypothetical protein [Kaistia sp. UC242_56]|uniref:hypothetical protein n=1 Tax=Kaistia sp. UC242_56 TaxID=3374625 RepID=UPI0037BDB960
MISPGIAPISGFSSAGRYAVIFAAALSVLMKNRSTVLAYDAVPTLFLGIFITFHSILFSPIVDVSALKSISWTISMLTVITAWRQLSHDDWDAVSLQVFRSLILVMVVSLPLLVLPLGYLVNGTGFQGILNHPQAMGPTLALLGAWSASQMFGSKRPPWHVVILVIVCVVLVLLSEARTAGLALLGGFSFAALCVSLLSKRRLVSTLPGLFSPRFGLITVVGVVLLSLFGSKFLGNIASYISKRGEASNLMEAYQGSRGYLIDAMQANISMSPWQGIGFGIASIPEAMVVTRDPMLGLPIGAAIEKGVMPLAVLEELGIPGFIFVAVWIASVLRRSARGGVASLSVALTVLLLNLGENTLFSAGGFGMLPIILLGWAITSADHLSPVRHAPNRRMTQPA